MLDPAQVQALAIIMVGAFLMVLATAVFYVVAFRPRLKEPESLLALGMLDDDLREELLAQRSAVEQLNTALTHHTHQLENATLPSDALTELHGVLASRTETADSLTGLIQAQADQIVSIRQQLDEWPEARARVDATQDNKLDEHARILAELDRELAAQATTIQGVDTKVGQHAGLLATAAEERRHQTTLIERVWDQVAQMVPLLNQLLTAPPRAGQDRLTDIKGIGPVYAGRLYEAGIHTFRQLAAMTVEEIHVLMDEPIWRKKSLNAAHWIEQAQHLASQREKVEKIV